MKKTIFLIILGVVTVGCIIYGTVYHIGGGFRNLSRGSGLSFHFDYDKDEEINDEHNLNQKLEAFSRIKIDTSILDIRIQEGEDFYISSSWNREWLRPEFSVDNGELVVYQHSGKKNKAGSNTCRVTISVPAATKLERLKIDSNVGEIKIRNIDAEDISIDTNVGEISLRDVIFDNVTIDSNVGEVNLETGASLKEYAISLSTDVGDVHYDGNRYKHSYNQSGNSNKSIKINTNVGEINVK